MKTLFTSRNPRFIALLMLTLFASAASTAHAQYSRYGYGGRSGYGGYGYGSRYGGYGYGSRYGSSYRPAYGSSYGFGRSYSPRNYGYGSSYRRPSSYRYTPNYSGGNRSRYGSPSVYRAPINRGSLYRTSQVVPSTNLLPARQVSAVVNTDGLQRGWQLLVSGDDQTALSQFANIAAQDSSAAEPKVGYALAATACGDATTAAWAMQRALSLDPDIVDRLQQREELRDTFSQLAVGLEQSRTASPYQTGNPNESVDFLLVNLRGKPAGRLADANPKHQMLGIEPAGPPAPTVIPEAAPMQVPPLPILL